MKFATDSHRPTRTFIQGLFLSLLLLFTFCLEVKARVYLDITSAELQKLPVAVPYFTDKMDSRDQKNGKEMADLLSRALSFHGFISIIPLKGGSADHDADWQTVGADFVVLAVYEKSEDSLVLEMRLMDTHNSQMILGKRYRGQWKNRSKIILKFSDEIILQLTGVQGISNSQIAFVSDANGHKEVYVSDVLGENVRQVTHHNSITVSPRFSPDGKRLSYTSYHRGNPNLYITDLSQSKTTKAISWHKGLNVAPAWSPNGKTLVVTLSKDGNPDLYMMAPNGNILNRLTNNVGINVSATWAPDGKRFAFVSDRGGKPQIYIRDMVTKNTSRLTYSGIENTTPSWSPKGDLIAYTGKDGDSHHIYVISPEGGEPRQLTKYWGEYEAPSWSPDGNQIVFSRTRSERKQLCTLFLKGQGVIPLFEVQGNQQFPQWSPRLQY